MQKIHSIQSLRACAASLVVIDHLIIEAVKFADPAAAAPSAWVLGAFGVDIFFIISGFIMYFIGSRMFDSAGVQRQFLLDRCLRIIPLYWLATLVWLLVIPGDFSFADTVKSALFIPFTNIAERSNAYPVLSPGWTLQYEMMFYVLFSASLLFRKSIGLIILSVFMASMVAFHEIFENSYYMPLILEFYTRPIILFFLIGVSLGVAREYLVKNNAIRIFYYKRHILTLACFGYAGYVLFFGYQMHQSSLGDTVYKVLAIILVSVAVLTEDPAADQADLVVSGFGDASYSLYLFHLPFISIMASSWLFGPSVFSQLAFVIVGLPALLASSLVIHRFVERPLTTALRSLAGSAQSRKGGS